MESHIVAEYSKRIRDGAKLRFSLTLSSSALLTAGVGADARVTEHTKMGLGVECAAAGGITLKLRASRFGQRLSIPILMSPHLHPRMAFLTCLLPGIGAYMLDRLLLQPRRLRARAE